MMKKYIKPNVVSVATISEGCLLAYTGEAGNGGFSSGGSGTGHAKVSNFDEIDLESD
jgi:hypothetical protein